METISKLYLTFILYIFLVIYYGFYDSSNPFYEFINSIFSLEIWMNWINRNQLYYILLIILIGITLLVLYYINNEFSKTSVPRLMCLYIFLIAFFGFYSESYTFYQIMNVIFDSETIPDWIEENTGIYYFICMLIGFLIIVSIYFVRRRMSLGLDSKLSENSLFGFISKILGVIMFFVLIILFLYSAEYILSNTTGSSIFSFLVMALIFFMMTSVLVKTFYKKPLVKIANDSSYIALIKNCLLYIPCLFIDLVDYIKYEYSITTRSSVILFVTMVILITLHFVLPYIKSYLYDLRGKQLVSEPINTSQLKNHGSYEELSGTINDGETKYDYRYGLSFWFYVNPQPPATNSSYSKYTSILNYGNKPNILYKADENKIMIKMTQGHKKEKKIFVKDTLPLQKWNHFVINYDGGTLDVFLNNELVGSKIKVVPFMTHDVITSGEMNGIYGGLCNVKYFDYTLMKHDIDKIYKSFKGKNPPII